MKKLIYAPSIMCAQQLYLGNQIETLIQHNFNLLHIDIMDLDFVPNISLGFKLVNEIKNYNIPLDIHLMVSNVDRALDQLDCDNNDIISVHIENNQNLKTIVDRIKQKGCKVGLVINPGTDIKKVSPYISEVDLVNIMCVEPGFAGQPFIKSSYEKVKILKQILKQNQKEISIAVDGGIGYEQIEKFHNLGADVFVLGTSSLFRDNLELSILKLKKLTSSLLQNDLYSFRPYLN